MDKKAQKTLKFDILAKTIDQDVCEGLTLTC